MPPDEQDELPVRTYGTAGPTVIVLHGGPAAAGSAGPLARGLADDYRIFEPWQRGSGDEPLTVARHVADLDELIQSRCNGESPALVGESWGAMLALAYAAAHPDHAGPLVLVGCGTLDKVARDRVVQTRQQRTDEALRERLNRLEQDYPDLGQRLIAWRRLTQPLEDYAPIATEDGEQDAVKPFDLRAHTETWNDMVRLQEEGVYPAAFEAIRSPVLMLHGDYDPHPGPMIRASLAPYLPQLEYHELARCGHSPWNERFAREAFFGVLRDWLARHCAGR
jgi:pimeloyl-ACP methyl ester carboxylesterase